MNKEPMMAERTNGDPTVALARRLKAYYAIGNFASHGWENAKEDDIAAAIDEVLAALRLELSAKS